MRNYEEWLEEVPEEITGDLLWKMKVYRLALFAADLGWRDVTKLTQDKRTVALADQHLPRSWLHQREHYRRLQQK